MSDTTGQPSQASQVAGANAATSAITALLQPFQAEAQATRVAIEDRNRAQRRINRWLIGFVGVTAVLVILVLWMLVRDNQRRAQSREILRNNANLSAQIADCTSTDGKCYQQNQKKLGATIQQLVEANKSIAVCARTTDSEAALDRCVAQRLAGAPKPRP
jgi:hypothetical protein